MANKFRDLLLRIGIDTKGFNADIGRVQRQITAFTNQTQALGKTLTTNITLPLGLAGAAAVKTFADFDRLEKGLDVFAQQGTTGAEELDKLLDVVKDARTTLDLKSAASGALQLQAVGIEADKARNIIKQLGIAATVSGSEIADISEIVRQFAQSLSLGRVLETDLRIIKQRIPAIGKILKDEFGTVTAEGLRSAGVSAQEFVDRLVKSIETNTDFQNVQISAAKAIETFTTNIQIAVAELGKIISESIDLIGTLDSISNGVARLTVFLKSLDDGTKETIVKIALFAASIGPVLIGISAVIKSGLLLKTTIAVLGTSFLDLLKVFGLSAVNLRNIAGQFGVAGNAAKGFALAVRSIALPIAAVTGAVLIVKKIFNDYQVQLDRANRSQDVLNRVSQNTNSTFKEQSSEINRLVGYIKDENASNRLKENSLKRLNELTNGQYRNLKLVNGEVKGITEVTKNYLEVLKLEIEIQQIQEEQSKIFRENAKLEKGNYEDVGLALTDYINIFIGGVKSYRNFGAATEYVIAKSKNAKAEYDANEKALFELTKRLDSATKKLANLGKPAEETEQAINGLTNAFSDLDAELAKIDYFGRLFGKSKLAIAEERLAAIKKALEDAFDPNNISQGQAVLIDQLTKRFEEQRQIVIALRSEVTEYQKALKEIRDIELSASITGDDIITVLQKQIQSLQEAQISIPVVSADYGKVQDEIDKLKEQLKEEVQSFIFNDLERDLENVNHEADNFGLGVEDLNNIKIDKLIDYLALVYDVLGENSEAAEVVRKKLEEYGVFANGLNQELRTFGEWVKQNAEQIVNYVERGVSNIFEIISEGFARRNEAKANLEEARKELLKLEATGRATKEELQAAEAAVLGFSRTVATNDLFENIARAFRQLVIEIGKAILKALAFAAIIIALSELIPELKGALKIAGLGSSTGDGLSFGKLIAKSFGFDLKAANGALVYGPVSALVGEGQGTTRRNPEVIAPLDKLKEYIGGEQGAMMLTSRLSGADLLLSVERAKRNRDR